MALFVSEERYTTQFDERKMTWHQIICDFQLVMHLFFLIALISAVVEIMFWLWNVWYWQNLDLCIQIIENFRYGVLIFFFCMRNKVYWAHYVYDS